MNDPGSAQPVGATSQRTPQRKAQDKYRWRIRFASLKSCDLKPKTSGIFAFANGIRIRAKIVRSDFPTLWPMTSYIALDFMIFSKTEEGFYPFQGRRRDSEVTQEQNNSNPGLPRPVRQVADAQHLGELFGHIRFHCKARSTVYGTQKNIYLKRE